MIDRMVLKFLIAILLICVPWTALAADGSPPVARLYQKKPTWVETIRYSREALAVWEKKNPQPVTLPDFGQSDFTVTAWIKTTAGGTILAKAPAAGDWKIQAKALFIRDGKLCYDIGWVGCVTSSKTVNDGQWHHVALVANGKEQHLYVDGNPDREGRLKGETDPSDCVLKIGDAAANFPLPNAFTGNLDEVRIYKRRLNGNEIRACAGMNGKMPTKDLVAFWPMDGDGTDRSVCDNNAFFPAPLNKAKGKRGNSLVFSGTPNPAIIKETGGNKAKEELWKRTTKDFADPQSQLEMTWEREDKIWEDDWTPGNLDKLAARYAKATRHDPRVAIIPDQTAPKVDAATGLAAVRSAYLAGRRDALVRDKLHGINTESLRRAVAHLKKEYGDAYPGANAWLDATSSAEREIAQLSAPEIVSGSLDTTAVELTRIQREALVLQNPLLAHKRILFHKRPTFQSTHYYTDYIDGFETYGGSVCELSVDDGQVSDLLPEFREGIIGRHDLSFDATRVVFDYKKKDSEGFRIYEAKLDGTSMRQLTMPPSDESTRIETYKHPTLESWAGRPIRYNHCTDDMHPCYLPDGGYVFVSTRCELGILCDTPDYFSTSVLYRIDANGDNMQKLTNSSVSESAPSIMNDGRILYTRWEYVDKGAVSVKCLWGVRPDGTGSVEVFGNDIDFPDTCNLGRAIPGYNNLLAYIGAPHMPLGAGAIIRIDTKQPIRTRRPMTYITPETDVRQEWGYNHDTNGTGQWEASKNGPLYMDAYPLSDSFFLASYNPDRPFNDASAYAVALVDAFGNRIEIYRDPQTSCWQPVLLEPRPVPPVLPQSVKPDVPKMGTLLMTDVHQGLDGIPRGTVKYLRIMEQVPRPWLARRFWDADDVDQQHAAVTKNTHLSVKVLHGIVPVYEDGSAYFIVPADKNIFLQALDENFMEVQRMRTYVNLRPGEARSCIGCHEQREQAPRHSYPAALKHPPAKPGPQPGEKAPRPIYYPADVQPILDKHCVSCHSGTEPKAGLDLSGELTAVFNRSYENILDRGLVKIIGENHPKTGNIALVPPKTLGSHASKIVTKIREGHHDVQLSPEEFCTFVTWVDSNAQYYGSYYGRRNTKYQAFPDFRPAPTLEAALGKAPYDKPSPAVFIEGSVRHPFIVTDHSGGGFWGGGPKACIFSADGKVEWEYPCAGSVHESWVLPNGNILITSNGVREITRDKKVVFEYKSDLYLTGCQRLPNGNTLIGENPLNRAVEVNPKGEVVKTVAFTTNSQDKNRNFRLMRQLVNGNYLVCHEGEGVVREYDPDGKVLREIPTPGGPYVAVRLKDGNTLIACGAGKQAIEVDPEGKTVWSLQNGDLPGVELNWMAGLQRLPNGNTVLTCWFPNKDWKGKSTPQILEVTRDKKVVWEFSAPDLIGSANNIQLLDVPGDATKGEVLR